MIRVRGQGKYELLSTCDDDISAVSGQGVRVEGILNKHRDDAATESNCAVEATTIFSDASPTTTTSIGPRQRKSSRGDSEEKKCLLGDGGSLDGKPEMMELSQKMVGTKKASKGLSPSVNSDFIEVKIRDDDTLQGLALKFRCPVSELKRVNNIYSTQDIHSFQKIKVPVKKHGLLKELLDDDANKRRSSKRRSRRGAGADIEGIANDAFNESIVRITDEDGVENHEEEEEETTEKTERFGRLIDLSDDGDDDRRNRPDSAYLDDAANFSSPTRRYGIQDLENLFPHRDISDCESGAESRRESTASGRGSDSGGCASDTASTPLVRTFYLSIRENMSASSNQSHLAKQFLSKMDADLSSIRQQRPAVKDSLEQVASTLTSKRIHPLAPSPTPPSPDESETYGTILGMSWRTLLAVAIGAGLFLFFVFFSYAAKERESGEMSMSRPHHRDASTHLPRIIDNPIPPAAADANSLPTVKESNSSHSSSSATPGLANSP